MAVHYFNKLFVVFVFFCRYENYSVILNTVISLFSLFTDVLLTIALHTPERQKGLLRILLFLRLLSWSYLYLNLLPFKYLIPTLYAKKFKLWLNVCLWIWYGASVWNSVNYLFWARFSVCQIIFIILANFALFLPSNLPLKFLWTMHWKWLNIKVFFQNKSNLSN